MKEKNAFSIVLVMLMVSVLLAISMSLVNATTSTQVSGSVIPAGATFSVNPAGKSDNTISYVSLTGMFTGSIKGAYTGEARWVNHNAGTPELWRNVHVVDTIPTANVMGKTGTLYFMVNGAQEGGTWVIIGGAGDLAGLHGQGTFTTAGMRIDYEGEIHFDP